MKMSSEYNIEFPKRDRCLVGFALVLSLVIIIPAYVENDIVRHILTVLVLSTLGVLICYHYSWITEKKELEIFFLVALGSGLCLPYLFSWIHELGHAITGIINGIEALEIDVFYPYGGVTHFPPLYFFSEDMVIKHYWIAALGSVGSVLIISILNRGLYHIKKIRFCFFFPLFVITSWGVLYEFNYLINGINDYINGINSPRDAYKFLFFYHQIDDPIIQIDPLFLRNGLIYLFIVILIWFGFNLGKRIKKEIKIIKKTADDFIPSQGIREKLDLEEIKKVKKK